MIIFRSGEKNYYGDTALEVVRRIESDARDYQHRGGSLRRFLIWSLNQSGSVIPPRDADLSDRLDDETLALDYLYLRDEYGAGELLFVARENDARC